MQDTTPKNKQEAEDCVPTKQLIAKRLFPFVVVFIGVVFCAALFYFFYQKREVPAPVLDKKKPEEVYRDGSNSYHGGDYQASISQFREVLKAATTENDKLYAQLSLGASLLKSKEETSFKEGYTTLIKLAASTSIDPTIATMACTALASEVASVTDSQVDLINSEAAALVGGVTINENLNNISNRESLYTRLFVHCNSIKKLPYTFYSLAGGMSSPYLKQVSGNPSLEVRRAMATEIQKLIKEGDTFTPDKQSPEMNAAGLFFRARALHASNTQLKNLKTSELDEAYKRAIDFGVAPSVEAMPAVQMYTYLARFFYANFLIKSYGGEKNDEAIKVVQPFATIATTTETVAGQNIRRYFIGISDNTNSENVLKRISLTVAGVSPDFKAFLVSIGFKGF